MHIAVQFSEFPVRIRFERPLTDRQLMAFCSANEALRVERNAKGEIELMSPNGWDGNIIEVKVVVQLAVWAEVDGRGLYFGLNGGVTLPDTSMRAPDAAWVSKDRAHTATAKQREGFAPVCPEFIIEVRSETDRLKTLQKKMDLWIANGAELGWLIDPKRKVVEIYREGEAPEIYLGPTSVYGTGPVAGFELVLSRIWG